VVPERIGKNEYHRNHETVYRYRFYVLVMVGAASGCCAMEFNADETAFPSPNAGIMQPMPVVSPAVIIDVTAIIVILSILFFIYLL
jgi:hypothetical protein